MKIFQRKKWYSLNGIQTIIFITLMTLIFTMFFLSIQPIALWDVLKNIVTYPMMFLNNYYPVLLLTIFLIGISGKVRLSLGIMYLLFSILGLVNRTKIMYRDFPLIPSDLMLIREAGSISASSGYAPDWKIVVFIIIGFILLLELLLRLEFPKMKIPGRLISTVLSISIFVGLIFTLYGSRDYYYSLPNYEANYNEVVSSNIRGFHYYFLYNISAYGYTKPDDYDEREVIAWEEDMEKENQQKADENLRKFQDDEKPHVIFVMGEAFTDISDHPTFIFTEENNPLESYDKMKAESILSGNIVATVFGGGTENTEYDVLTGNQVLYQSDGNVSAYKSINGKTYSLGWLFKDLGYETYGMHPGEPWFYNRQNAYEYLGLDNNYFKNDFEDPQMKGLYISEDEFAKKIMDDFENHIDKNENPMFYYSVNIQNHGPYLNYKYNDHERFDYDTTIELEPEVREQFDNLFVGIKDMSDALKDMGDYFSQQEDPVILVYFGDHQPFLGEDYMAYRAIDYDLYSWSGESFLESRTTPFLIWANDSGEKYLNASELNLPEDNRISANYLGVMLLEMLGLDKLDPYYSYINNLRKEFPVLSRHFIVKPQYNESAKIIDYAQLPEEDLTVIEKFKKWQYYRLNNFRENDFE